MFIASRPGSIAVPLHYYILNMSNVYMYQFYHLLKNFNDKIMIKHQGFIDLASLSYFWYVKNIFSRNHNYEKLIA